MTRRWLAVAVAGAVLAAGACGGGGEVDPLETPEQNGGGTNTPGGNDTGQPEDAGSNNPGGQDSGTDGGDAGTIVDSGTDAGTPTPTPGPWPTDTVLNYSSEYSIGSIQSVGVDDAYNIWLLDGERIGVLRPGTDKPVWSSNIGQAKNGFGPDKLAEASTVICGGAANQAYVGYYISGNGMRREDVNDPEFLRGDMDVVQLNADGSVSLTEHLSKSVGSSQPWPQLPIGIHNTNDWHYDEDLSVLTCKKVMKGPFKGELYIGTNHGVTRIRGLVYNSHRHPLWMDGNSHMIGYSYGLGIGQNGDVLIGNDWNVGILSPPEDLTTWDSEWLLPWGLHTHNQVLNTEAEFDYWRGFEQTTDGKYYLGSDRYGLWELIRGQWVFSADWKKVSGLPTENINALQATDDGSLFIATDDSGLWRMNAQGQFEKVSGVSGNRIRQLVYDPTVSPSMLYVLTSSTLYVIRGH